MKKSAILFLLVICCNFTILTPSYAVDKFSPDTEITKDNIYEVLEYYGIDFENFIEEENADAKPVKIKDLEKAIEQAKSLEKEINIEKTIHTSDYPMYSIQRQGTKMLYDTHNYDGFLLSWSCGVNYSDGRWKNINAMDVSISSPDILLVRRITKKDLNGEIVNNGKTVRVNYKLRVDVFVGLKFGAVKVPGAGQNITGRVQWHENHIPR